MKRIILFAILTFVFIGCRDEGGVTPVSDQPLLGKPNFIIYDLATGSSDTFQTLKYYIKDSKVLSCQSTNSIYTDGNYFDTYVYDRQDNLVKMYRNSRLFRTVEWNGSTAYVRVAEGRVWDTVEFETGNLTKTSILHRRIVYDAAGNATATYAPWVYDRIIDEFLNYDTNVLNPFYMIRSIAAINPLPYEYPYSKNIFRTRKTYPYRIDDLIFPMKMWQTAYTLDSQGRIISLKSEYQPLREFRFEYR